MGTVWELVSLFCATSHWPIVRSWRGWILKAYPHYWFRATQSEEEEAAATDNDGWGSSGVVTLWMFHEVPHGRTHLCVALSIWSWLILSKKREADSRMRVSSTDSVSARNFMSTLQFPSTSACWRWRTSSSFVNNPSLSILFLPLTYSSFAAVNLHSNY